MREAASEIARGDCSAITKAVDKVQKAIEGIASPIIDRVKHLAQKVGDFFKGLWERFGAPIWDFSEGRRRGQGENSSIWELGVAKDRANPQPIETRLDVDQG